MPKFKPQFSWISILSLGFAAFTLTPAQICQAQPSSQSAPTESKQETTASETDKKSALSSHMELIAQAKRLEDASSKADTPLKQALKTAMSKGKTDLDELNWVAENGTIAGRVYASAIIDKLNNAPKGALFENLLKDQGNTNVGYLSAGATCHYTVSDIAVDQRSAHPIIKLLP